VIDLAQLPPEGLRLSGAEPGIVLGGRDALRDAAWSLTILPSGQDVYLDVRGEATWEGACSRCLEPIDLAVRVESQFLGSKDPELVVRGSHTLGSQDLDVVFLPEPLMDEKEIVKEQFLLHVPMHPLCREECQGLCPQCGKNWNKGPCQCRPELVKEPSALAKALSGLKLKLDDTSPEPSPVSGDRDAAAGSQDAGPTHL
jgi:uncharacterized protein